MTTRSIITISREYGSGGKEVGKRLAEQLGVPYYDHEIISLAATKSGTSVKLLEEHDEKGASGSLLYSISVLRDTLAGNFPMSDRIFMVQSQVINELADQGPCVIVGRCADFILRERDNVLNFFLHAPMPDRVRRACEQYGIEGDKAAAEVVKVDKQRAAYNDYYSFLKWGQGNHYDLCVNSSIGIDNTIKLLEQYIAMREG